MQRLRLIISYDGSDFWGWQKQPNKPTIQNEIEKALAVIFQKPIKTIASGRTDAKAHAFNQVVHFDVDSHFNNWTKIQPSLNKLTPSTIVIKSVEKTPNNFHSLASSVAKTYRYLILNQPTPIPHLRHLSYHYPKSLNLDKLNSCCEALLGTHDFKSFQNSGTPVPDTVRKIFKAQWKKKASGLVYLTLTGDGFLKQMVRNIVACSLHALEEKESYQYVKDVMSKKDRKFAPSSAPAHGLFLSKVYYPQQLDKKCQKI